MVQQICFESKLDNVYDSLDFYVFSRVAVSKDHELYESNRPSILY